VKRLGALLLAMAMIGGALWGRARLDGPGGGTTGSTSSGRGGTVVCASELEAACQSLTKRHPELKVVIEEAQTTLERLVAAPTDAAALGFDGWLVPQPWPAMAAGQRQQTGATSLMDEPSPVLARSPLVIAAWNDRRDALQQRCGAEITWKCIGQAAGDPWATTGPPSTWGVVKPGHPTPARTAAGLLALSEATASWFGTTNYASNDFTDPAFRGWFTKMERSVPSFPAPPRTPLDEMLFTGPASFDLTGSTEAAAGPAIATSRDSGRLSILYPAPLTTADVVLAPVSGSAAGGRVLKLIESNEGADALAAAGWRVDGRASAPGIPDQPTLPAEAGLPKPGVLQALRSLWVEVVR
jgi:hypothetical protein